MKRRQRVKTKPVNLDKLIKIMGEDKAGNSLGLTPFALRKYIRLDAAPLSTELAAQLLCGSNLNKQTSAVITADPTFIDAVKKIVEGSGGSYSRIN